RGSNRVYDPFRGLFLDEPVIALPSDARYQTIYAGWTSVMLPLLHTEGFQPRVLVMGGQTAQRIDLGSSAPSWQPTAARVWSGDPPERIFGLPVLLPTGEVMYCGGTRQDGTDDDRQDNAVTEVEIYDPGIDWTVGEYLAGTGTWTTLPSAENATVRRHYHSTALLLPNGTVWTAGSNGPSEEGGGRELRIEVYSPAYVSASGRPEVLS